MYPKVIKPLVDKIFALILIILLLPLMIIVGLLIYFTMGSPILFRQQRPGLHENIFEIYKFRTMCSAVDEEGKLLPDEMRLGGIGKQIRKFSLDELPQLFNVLKGEMSFIGPRPLLTEYLPLYNREQKKRHDVKPGITGWAQVNGYRGDTSIAERTKYDIWYVENWSLLLDIKIILRTIMQFFHSPNAY